jgi:D-alanine transaminase
MNNLGYYNGNIGLIEEISIPITDRAFYFGDGVYEAVLCRNNIPYLLSVHLDRFYRNCDKLDIKIPMEKEEIQSLIKELVKKVDANEKFIYFHVSRGSALRSHTYEQGKGNLCIMITPFSLGNVYEKVSAVTYDDNRYGMCNIKTLNLLPSVLAAQYAKNKGCDEAIFVRDGIVTEGSHCNVSIVKNGLIVTHPSDCHILPGVARSELIKCANKQGITVCERRYSINELMDADEVILTSSGKIIRGIDSINGIQVGNKAKDILFVLQNELYRDYIEYTSK